MANGQAGLPSGLTPPARAGGIPGEPANRTMTLVEPPTGWQPIDVPELWRFRELVYFLAWRDVKIRYKQAALGAAWAVVQPLLTMVVFTIFFGKLAGVPSDKVPYPLFSYSALLLWTYFAGVLAQGGQSLLSNSNLITKVYFPRAALPVSIALAGLLDFAVGLSFLVILMVYYRIYPGWSLLLAPMFVAGLI